MKKIFATQAMSMTIVMTASAASTDSFPTTNKYPYGFAIEGKFKLALTERESFLQYYLTNDGSVLVRC